MSKFKPLKNFIVVTQEDPQETVVPGGVIVAPSVNQTRPVHGFVLDVGPDVKDIRRGDRVVFEKFSGKEITVDGDKLLIMAESSVYGTVAKDAVIAV